MAYLCKEHMNIPDLFLHRVVTVYVFSSTHVNMCTRGTLLHVQEASAVTKVTSHDTNTGVNVSLQ